MPSEANKTNKKNKEKVDKKVIQLDKQKESPKLPVEIYDPEEIIFALDIGTRSIVGIVGIQQKDNFKVISAEVLEHKNRAMLDGQIHDINQVAENAKQVKEKLEQKTGLTLKRVAIAAAGRVLKTCEVKIEKDIDPTKEIDKETVSSIEIEGIQLAQLKLDEEIVKEEKTQFYCVGYSVINYYLNNYVISTLVGHRAKRIGADILATFLPHIVVDSLYTVMSKIGLEVASLTLEPIAAINVTIPKDLRLLNLALIDIGAGTSDIALTRDGSVVAYAMAPIAGDEITEKIAQHYLVDFNTSEKIKVSLSGKADIISFIDILGKKHSIDKKDILEVIKPSIELLSETIAQKILEYNHKAPNAIFLIGGGSQVPGLTDMIAERLKIHKDRVVVRGRDIIQNITFTSKKLSGPEAITPIGIAVTAQMQKGQDFMAVTINGKKIKLFNSKKLNVADALILIGFNPSHLIGRTGKSITFELNGVKKVVKGGHGTMAEIYVNDHPANLETILNAGDNININPAVDGKNAEVNLSEFLNSKRTGKISINNSMFDIDTKVYINGRIGSNDYSINDGDKIEVTEINTIKDLLEKFEIDRGNFEIYVNSEKVDIDYRISANDIIELKKPAESQKIEQKPVFTEFQSNFENNPAEKVIEKEEKEDQQTILEINNTITPEFLSGSSELSVIINGKTTLIKGLKNQYIFVDVFNYIDFDLTKPKGNIVLKLNGKEASFTDSIRNGDRIDIFWEKLG